MGEEPSWAELLFTFALTAVVPVVVGLAVICSLVGLTLWVKARLVFRGAPGRTGQGQDSPSTREEREEVR
ncbi:hypothetical protein [Streptomyces sp. NPDC001770]